MDCASPLPLLNCSNDSTLQSARGLAQFKTWRIFGTLLIFLAITISVRAQNYSVDWYKIAGGGGTSTNGQYSVTGTIGQPDASGAMNGGNFSMSGGFWSLISVVQTAGVPTLHISHSDNTITIYWQDVSGWSLQQNNNLAVTNGWSASTGVTTTNGTDYLNLTSPTGNLFFRLTQP